MAALAPSTAQACGGTFCDSPPPVDPGQPPPPPMPVDQTGETIIFAFDGDYVEAHIQIEFDPDSGAEGFAWLIPMPEIPEFGVSSDALFDELQLATSPVFSYSSSIDACQSGGSGGGGGGWGGTGGGGSSDTCSAGQDTGFTGGTFFSSGEGESSSGGVFEGDDDSGQSGAPDVVQHGFAGAFEYYVLDGGTVEGVMTWLGDNNFDQDPDAEPILQEYLDAGHVFVALKLRVSEGASAIHPIRMRYPGSEFCVPLKLTSIAAVDDMAVRVMVLGESRAAPANWRHVVLNPVRFDWINVGDNYEDVLIEAIDEPEADGHAWVTQYAGSSGIVNSGSFVNLNWDAEAFDTVTPQTLVETMQAQQMLGACAQLGCEVLHPLAQSVLELHLPVPDGVDAGQFYGCVECFEGLIDTTMFDPAAVRATIEERIIGPAVHSRLLLQQHPMLTRMTTRISPYEMTEDPTFLLNADLGPVTLPTEQARETDCNQRTSFMLSYILIANVRLADPNAWPELGHLPAALRIEQIASVGLPQTIVDNTQEVLDAVQVLGPATIPAGTQTRAKDSCIDDGFRGCGCRADGSAPVPTAALTLLALMAWRRRR